MTKTRRRIPVLDKDGKVKEYADGNFSRPHHGSGKRRGLASGKVSGL